MTFILKYIHSDLNAQIQSLVGIIVSSYLFSFIVMNPKYSIIVVQGYHPYLVIHKVKLLTRQFDIFILCFNRLVVT